MVTPIIKFAGILLNRINLEMAIEAEKAQPRIRCLGGAL
jgi:hypothetical protein